MDHHRRRARSDIEGSETKVLLRGAKDFETTKMMVINNITYQTSASVEDDHDDGFDDDAVNGDDVADDDQAREEGGKFFLPETFEGIIDWINDGNGRKKPTNCSYEFVYLPTTEGLVSQFNELRNFWSHVRLERHFYTVLHRSQVSFKFLIFL